MSKKIEWTVEMADSRIEYWKKVKETIRRAETITEEDWPYTTIFKLYLKHTSVTEVARILREQGVQVPSPKGSRKIQSNDISEMIRTADIPDKDLQNLVRSILDNATDFINNRWN